MRVGRIRVRVRARVGVSEAVWSGPLPRWGGLIVLRKKGTGNNTSAQEKEN